MYCIDSYKDLISEIEMSKARIEGFEKQKEILIKLMYNNAPKEIGGIDYSGMPGGSKNYMSLDRIVDRIGKLDSALYIETSLLENMENTKGKVEEKLKGLEGTDYKVAYMKEIEGKSIQEIADELGYAYKTIANTLTKIRKN